MKTELRELLRKYWAITAIFVVLALLYVLRVLLTAPDKATMAKYHISSLRVHELALSVVVPYIVIWIVALVGYVRLKDYTERLGVSKDGLAFRIICYGVLWFALWLPLSTLITTFGTAVYQHSPASTAWVVRVENYLNILILVPAFLYIDRGSKRLARLARLRSLRPSELQTLLFVAFSALYTFMVLADSQRRVSGGANSPASYYLPDWVIVLTVVIPRLLMWYIGVQAVNNLVQYRRKVSGSIYRQALKRLAIGSGVVVGTTILLRCIQSLSHAIGQLSLGVLLLLIYLILALMAVGYVLLAKGARRLQQIEES